MEAVLRELLLAAVNAEVVEKNAVSVHETYRKRVREDDATCAESDDICMQLQRLKLELNIARESASRIVEPASVLLQERLKALDSVEPEAARSRPPISPELAMRISQNKEQVRLRQAAKIRRLNEAAQWQAEDAASFITDVGRAPPRPP